VLAAQLAADAEIWVAQELAVQEQDALARWPKQLAAPVAPAPCTPGVARFEERSCAAVAQQGGVLLKAESAQAELVLQKLRETPALAFVESEWPVAAAVA
jgi:hypothetical protein